MWRRDRGAGRDCLRIGRLAVERWAIADGVLTLRAQAPLPQDVAPRLASLNATIRALYPDATQTSIDVVLESAWVPVTLVDTGAALLRSGQVDALARHRLGLQFSDAADPVAGWDLRIEQRVGDRHALVYGMSPLVRQALIDAGSACGLTWSSMSPAFAWGLERMASVLHWGSGGGWFLWPEQDRTLVARLASGRVCALDPGAAPLGDGAAAARLVNAERVRQGMASSAVPIIAATWDAGLRTPKPRDVIDWLDVRNPHARLERAGMRAGMAGTTA
ncbi:MAG: hypothetical protein ABI702_11475 [Burkholderiales bacterium]